MTDERRPGTGLWVGLVVGVPIMVRGVIGVLDDARRVDPAELARWVLGSAVVHDAIVLPVVLTAALVARRVTPAAWWAAVRWALMTSGVVLLVSWPFVRGYGRRSSNPSLLPRDYTSGVLVVLALVWGAAALLSVRTRGRSVED